MSVAGAARKVSATSSDGRRGSGQEQGGLAGLVSRKMSSTRASSRQGSVEPPIERTPSSSRRMSVVVAGLGKKVRHLCLLLHVFFFLYVRFFYKNNFIRTLRLKTKNILDSELTEKNLRTLNFIEPYCIELFYIY